MESKIDIAHHEQEAHERSSSHLQQGGVNPTAAHLFEEDSQGKVISRLLLPRPTDDPRDPLTWPLWRKHLIMTTTCLFVFLSNYITVSISPILVSIINDFDITLEQAGWLITFNLLFLGLGNLLWVPLSHKIGKRPVLILCAGTFFFSSIWSAVASSYSSLFGARIIQGFGASACEALGPAIVADLYFLHERGTWVGFYTLMFTVGVSCGGIFAGLVANASSDWRWVFWMNVILTGVLFLATVLFQAETNFDRPQEYETGEGLDSSELPALRARTKSSLATSLSLTSWYDRQSSIWWLLWRPWLTLRYPAVIWCTLLYGVCLGWLALQQTADSAVFPALYNYSALAVGNISIAYLIASFIGCAIGGPLSDWVIAFITKRRGGYFVPEFRLWCLIPSAVFVPVGLMLWGCGLEFIMDPMVAVAGTAITYGVLCAVPATGMTYVIDNYRALAGETMTILTAAKNAFGFGLSFAVFPWLERDGFLKVSGWNLLISGVIFLTTIPMYVYGDRLRRWSAKFAI